MNPIEFAYQFGGMSVDSSSSSVPPPPASLSSSSSASSSLPYELDCTGFDGMSSSPSLASLSSYGSLSSQDEPQGHESQSSSPRGMTKGWGSTMSRSRCVHNLSTLGSACSESSISPRQISSFGTGPNEGWGYYVDTRSR